MKYWPPQCHAIVGPLVAPRQRLRRVGPVVAVTPRMRSEIEDPSDECESRTRKFWTDNAYYLLHCLSGPDMLFRPCHRF